MERNEKTALLVTELERTLGSCCHNKNSYNGWTQIQGLTYRYPVHYICKDGSEYKAKYYFYDIDLDRVSEMNYKFGTNQLFVGEGLFRILELLERRFDLDFEKLLAEEEKRSQEL
ncbi:hypothetical protein NXH64_14805 [Butyrivibrio fibrisolvens]|uniref:hypothetical protein n=1 Tax=Pseudobutyrivibrio ruminis TaxID=46206 RepID=UPI0012DFDC92|nr:hypothetical protein [Pseudobutyrivibrio ruminis]MDC7280769.1 hypothetical protein [Butyrivibrio fibrisolvens]